MNHLSNKARYLLLAVFAVFNLLQLKAQNADMLEVGFPFITNYSSKTYHAHSQNYVLLQDKEGIMYAGNNAGVLQYDGRIWKLIPTSLGSAVRSMDMDKEGTIYIGAQGEFGYLAPDSLGSQQFVSLSEKLGEKDAKFADVWSTYVTPQGVFFLTVDKVFRWKDDTFKVWNFENSLLPSPGFYVNDRLYINKRGEGLLMLQGDEFVKAPGGNRIPNERIYAMLPFQDGKLLIATRSAGLYVYDGSIINPFETTIDAFLRDNLVSGGLQLADGLYGLTTLRGGIAVINESGKLVEVVNRNSGLAHNQVWGACMDRQQGLWLALDDGLSRVELFSPFRYFSDNAGLEGSVMALARQDNTLYAATTQGVYMLVKTRKTDFSQSVFDYHSYFKAFPGFRTEARDLVSFSNSLLVASAAGVYRISNGTLSLIFDGNANELYVPQTFDNVVLAGLNDGLLAVRNNSGSWQSSRVGGISSPISTIAEAGNEFWLATTYEGIIRMKPGSDITQPATVTYYNSTHGLPSDKGLGVLAIDGKVYATSDKGLFAFDGQKFIPAQLLSSELKHKRLFHVGDAADGKLWVLADGKKGQLNADGSWDAKTLARLQDIPLNDVFNDRANKLAWFSGPEGLVTYSREKDVDRDKNFSTLLNLVMVGTDSTLHKGAYTGNLEDKDNAPVLSYTYNTLQFQFTNTNYDYSPADAYQYLLEGFDKDWSAWTPESKKEYTNLPEGSYVFHVRARNVYGDIGSEAYFSFSVLPPWYRTWWAYVGAIAILGVLVYFIIMLRLRQLSREKHKLEEQVSQRTAELQDSLQRLKATQQQLVVNEKLASLGQLTAGIAHEIKNPLNFVNNFSEVSDELLEELAETLEAAKDKLPQEQRENVQELMKDLRQNVQKIGEHGRRADDIVKNMLMHSRKDSGDKDEIGVNELVNEYVNLAYRGLRGKNSAINVNIEEHLDKDAGKVFVQKQDVGRVLLNIANNAFYAAHKKTEKSNGEFKPTVTVTTRRLDKNRVEIRIRDNGTGISKENLDKIFNPFFTTKPTGEGTGLGLSISHDIIVKGHGGELKAESNEGEYTEFIIVLNSQK